MQIDNCLILAAGLGTRMGAIGKKWPKVLWPVFEKSLLSLQVSYAKYLGVKNIYINLFYMSELILTEAKKDKIFDDVIFLKEEPEIFDIGGAVHNLARREEINYSGKLLILNADQFLFLEKDQFFDLIASGRSKLLFCNHVNSSSGYNGLEIESQTNLVRNIVKNEDIPMNSEILTYSGNSLIDLSTIEPSEGISKFFDSVCLLKKEDVFAQIVPGDQYWDFGTANRYVNSLRKILRTYRENTCDPFLRFLVDNRALKTWKIDLGNLSYHSKKKDVINLNLDSLDMNLPPCVILSGLPSEIPDQEFVFKDGEFIFL